MIWSSFLDTSILHYITTGQSGCNFLIHISTIYVMYFQKQNIHRHKTFISKLPMQSNMCQLLNLWEIVCWLVYSLLSKIELWILLSCNRIFAILIKSEKNRSRRNTNSWKYAISVIFVMWSKFGPFWGLVQMIE